MILWYKNILPILILLLLILLLLPMIINTDITNLTYQQKEKNNKKQPFPHLHQIHLKLLLVCQFHHLFLEDSFAFAPYPRFVCAKPLLLHLIVILWTG